MLSGEGWHRHTGMEEEREPRRRDERKKLSHVSFEAEILFHRKCVLINITTPVHQFLYVDKLFSDLPLLPYLNHRRCVVKLLNIRIPRPGSKSFN